MEIDELTLHWLAGLLEGEGSFCVGTPSNPNTPYIVLQTTDEDVIAKVASIFGTKYIINNAKQSEERDWRKAFQAKLSGQDAVELMKLLHPLMGKRRQGQINRAVESYQGDRRKVMAPDQMEELRRRSQNGENVLKLANEFGISKSLAYYIKNGYKYKRV